MERPSQLILRNARQLASGGVFLFNPPPDNLYRELKTAHGPLSLWSQDYGDYRWFRLQGVDAGFGVVPQPEALTAQVILFAPREKDRLDMLLHYLASALPAGGELWLVGENQAGIRSAGKHLDRYFNLTAKFDTARHCTLYRAAQASPGRPFRLEEYRQKWLLGSPPEELRMVSLPGAFAHGRLDAGTALLLKVLSGLKGSSRPNGRVLDFACGIGIIGMSLKAHDPTLELTLLDSSAMALESARQSLEANSLSATVVPSYGLAEVRWRFDWIVTNPPFHQGVGTNYEITRRFFREAGSVLDKQGKMLLVCNRHLPYEGWLSESFAAVDSLVGDQGFKVLRAARAKS